MHPLSKVGLVASLVGFVATSAGACRDFASSDADDTSPPDASVDSPSAESGADVDAAGATDAGSEAITGEVLDVFGVPVANASVRIGTATTKTGPDGRFRFASAPPTYDLDIVSPGPDSQKEVTSLRALTTRSPKVSVNHALADVVRSAPVSGTFTPPLSYGTNEHLVIGDTEQYFGYDQTIVVADPAAGSTWTGGTAVWFGRGSTPLTYWALRFVAPTVTGNPTSFTGFMRAVRTATADTADTSFDVTLGSVTSSALAGTVGNLPASAPSATVFGVVRHTADPYGHIFHRTLGVMNAFSIVTPSAEKLSVNAAATVESTAGGITETHWVWKANVAPNATGVSLAFGSAASPTTPTNGATGVSNDATFTWSAGAPSGVYMLVATCGSSETGYRATLFTTNTSVKLSDASAIGAAWPVNQPCSWSLTRYGKITSVDGVAVANGRNRLDRWNGPIDGSYATVSGYTFSTP